jgi:putative Ca2+/H+ antiporter (TMEM165/GDT1 family)
MDWHVFWMTFTALFLAELGDKTQLAAISLSADTGSRLAVFAGASAALVLVTAIGVAVGGALGEALPVVWVKRAAALVFLLIGALMLAGKL